MNKKRLLTVMGGSKKSFTPDTLSGLALWFSADSNLYTDAAKTTAATNDDDLIYTWGNKVTGGNDFVQATEGARPLLKTVLGLPFLRFDGTDDVMKVDITADTTQTLFVVVKKLSAASTYKAFFGYGTYSNIYAKSTDGAPADQWRYVNNEAGGVVNLGGTVTNLSVISIVYNGTTAAKISIDGGTPTEFDPKETTPSFATINSLAIGARAANSAFIDCDIAEVIRYNEVLSDSDRAKVESYLEDKWTNPT